MVSDDGIWHIYKIFQSLHDKKADDGPDSNHATYFRRYLVILTGIRSCHCWKVLILVFS